MSAPRRSQRTKSKPDMPNMNKAQEKNTVNVKHPENTNIKDLNKSDNLNKQALTPFHIKRFVCKICKKGFERKYLFKKHIFLHSRQTLISAKRAKLREESLKKLENTLPVKSQLESEAVSVNDIPEIVSVKDIPQTILDNHEPETSLVKDKPELVSVKDIPETASVENEPETIFDRGKPEVPDMNAKKFDHVIQKVNDVEMIIIPEYPDIKLKMVKGGKHPYMCYKCDLGFWTKKAFEAHAPVHMLKKVKQPDKKFRCDVCSKQFTKLCDVERHIRVHTGEKPSICNICNKGFVQAHNLSKHLLTHLHIKPFICEICNKQFGRNDVLRRHLLIHSVQKPSNCSVCGRGFIRQSQLLQHMRKKHPDHSLDEFMSDDEESIKNEDSMSDEEKTSKVKS